MKMTWEDCAAAGMTATEAARARGKKVSSASHYAKLKGLIFRDGRRDEANAERSRQRMRALHADPDFAKAHAERMRALHADQDADMRQPHIRALDAAGLLDDYRTLTRKRYSKAEALSALGVSA